MRNWQTLVNQMSDVQKLVHLAMRQTADDEQSMASELTKIRQRVYNDELSIQARRSGCVTQRGRLTAGPELSVLSNQSKDDAKSIVNTYNHDLAASIINIKKQTPTANRNTYISRLQDWELARQSHKAPAIAEYTEVTARAQAQQDFYRLNNLGGFAKLMPRTAVCPICQGWINRGKVPMKIAQNNPPPYHLKCPHLWETEPERVDDCRELWVG